MGQNNRSRTIILIAVTLLFFMVTFSGALEYGWLGEIPGYDDILYLVDGGLRYEKLVN